MALTLVPPQLAIPSVEPIARSLLDALQSDLADALGIIQTQFPSPVLILPVPDATLGYSYEVVNLYDLVQNWPFVSVFSGNATVKQGSQQRPGGLWQTDLYVRAFLQAPDSPTLVTMLDRYGAAIWLVAVNADANHALGAQIDYSSVMIEPDQSGGVANERAIQVSFTVEFFA